MGLSPPGPTFRAWRDCDLTDSTSELLGDPVDEITDLKRRGEVRKLETDYIRRALARERPDGPASPASPALLVAIRHSLIRGAAQHTRPALQDFRKPLIPHATAPVK
jgi:hypothetical protein